MDEKCEILNKIFGFRYIRPFWGVVDAVFWHFQMVTKQIRTKVPVQLSAHIYSGQILVLVSAVICVAKCGQFL